MKTFFNSHNGGIPAWLLASLVCVLALCSSPRLNAQTLSGMNGTVTDATGAVVAGATVTVTNDATGVVSRTITSSAGSYSITDLIPGVYTVNFEKTGFESSVQKNVYIDAARKSTVDAKLKVGAITETVEVNAHAISLETEQPEIGTVVENKIVQETPVEIGGVNGGVGSVGRQIDDYLFLAPGVQGGEFSHRISGGLDFQNEVTFNGVAAVQSETKGFQSFINPPFEMVNEIRVLSSVFSAQYGLAQGVASYQFASGTNTLHGDGFEILRNDMFDAPGAIPSTAFTDANGVLHKPVPVDKEHNFGFSLGGPVILPKIYDGRNKTFFFTTLEWYRLNQSTGSPMTVPTALEKQGNFTDYPFPIFAPVGWTPPAGCSLVPGQRVPGQIIPQNCFSSVSKGLLQFIPDPNLPGAGSPVVNNLSSQVGVLPIRQHNWGFSIDHNLTDKQKIHGSYWRDKTTNPSCCDNNAFYPATNPLTGLNPQVRLGTGFFLTYSNTISNGLVMTAGMGWMGEINNQFNGHTGTLSFPGVAGSTELPHITFSGGDVPNQPTDWGQARVASINRKLGLSFDNNWLYNHGRHTLNFGVEIHRAYQDDHECQQCAGNVNFSDHITSDGVNFGTTGSGFASFLFGMVDSADRHFAPESKLRNFYIAPYVQDNIKITPKLTIDAGLRWDIMRPFTEEHNNVTFFDRTRPNPGAISPVSGQPLLGAANHLGNCSGCAGYSQADTHWKNFSPRLGFAYELNSKTVLLGGYAVNFLESGAYEFGDHKVANDYGQLLNGVFQANSNGTNAAGLGEWDTNPVGNPGPLPFTPTVNIGTGSLHLFSRDPAKPAYSMAWNAGIQRELPGNMFFAASYVGNRALHMPGRLNVPNQLNPAILSQLCPNGGSNSTCVLGRAWTSAAGQAALQAAGFGKASVGPCPATSNNPGRSGNFFTPYVNFLCDFGSGIRTAQALRGFPMYTGISANFDSSGVVDYNALQTQIQKRFTSGLTFLVAYTLSRTMSNTDSGFATFNGSALNGFDKKAQWSIANNDQTHLLNISGVYELPIGPGKAHLNQGGLLAKNLLGGWQLSGIFQYSSGQPFGISANGTPTLGGGNRGNLLPNVPFNLHWNTYYQELNNPSNQLPVLNSAAFSDPTRWGIGNSRRNLADLRNPWNQNESIALAKHFFFGERVTGELRMEFFNVLNRMQICGGPNQAGALDRNISHVGAGTFGLINGGAPCQNNSPRQGQAFFKVSF